MKRSVSAILAALVICMVPVIGLAQVPYSQDFETLPMVDGSLAGDGWLVYGNIFDPAGNYLWGHGPWPAPNNLTPGNWEDIVTGQGGAAQDIQQLVFEVQLVELATLAAGKIENGNAWFLSHHSAS